MDERGKATRTAYDTVAAAYAAALPDLSHEAPLDRAMIDEVVRELPEGASVLVAFQVGSGPRTVRRAYGRELALTAHLHTPCDVESALSSVDLVPETSLVRAPRATEAHSQAILLARRRLG